MRLALKQMRAVCYDVATNYRQVASAAEEAHGAGADCLLVPELALTSYGAGERFPDLAEPLDGELVGRLATLSARLDIALVVGFAERADDALYNSALLLKDGALATVYRKRQLFGDYEKRHFTPGDEASAVVEIGGLRCGLAICYDIEFPETARELALAGADAILVPTALPQSAHAAFVAQHMVAVRAFENQIFVAYCDHCGQDDSFAYAGLSGIMAPDGSDLGRAGADDEPLLIADLDPADYAQSRSENPYLQDLRAAARG